MKKQQVIINIGVSGSGKTTWSTEYIKNNSKTLRINRDDIRKTLVGDLIGYYQRSDLNTIETIITNTEAYLIVEALRKNYDLIIDNTHLKSSYIKERIEMVKYWAKTFNNTEIDIKFKIFEESNKEILKQRVQRREGSIATDVSYIDRQVSQLKSAISYVKDNYPNQILK